MTTELVSGVTTEDYDSMTLAEMEARNAERAQALARQGIGINPGTGYLETMLELLLGDQLHVAREIYQRKIGAQLDQAEGQVLRMRLGVAPGPN